jgi:hypothetical protein
LRECKPPFSPDHVVGEFATLLKSYGVSQISGDRGYTACVSRMHRGPDREQHWAQLARRKIDSRRTLSAPGFSALARAAIDWLEMAYAHRLAEAKTGTDFSK